MFGGVNMLSKFQLPSSYRLWFMILWRYGGKGWLSHWINDEAVYRTAPATPGLLIRHKDFRPSSFVLRQAQGTPSGFWKGMDWRALVESRPPNIGKLEDSIFFLLLFFSEFFLLLQFLLLKKSDFLSFFEIFLFLKRAGLESCGKLLEKKINKWNDFLRFLYVWNGLDWRALVESHPPNIQKLRG